MEQALTYINYLSEPDWEGIRFMFMAALAASVIATPVLFVLSKIFRRPATFGDSAIAAAGTGMVGFVTAAFLFGVIQYHEAILVGNNESYPYIVAGVTILAGIMFIRRYVVSSVVRATLITLITFAISWGLFIAVLFSGIFTFN